MKIPTLEELAAQLADGKTTSRKLVEESLAKIANPKGEGARIFLKVDAEGARAGADYQDGLRKRGYASSCFAGIPFSVKDLFDVAGQVTTAGSKVLADAAPATQDAQSIAALKAAGFVVLGRTNMTEFAYSGVGINPHYGTPLGVFDRAHGRIPGGSSSGAAVAVADGICALGIGSDTGGSCRIPAAYNGIYGFKPSTGRVSTHGAYPLSSSLDSIGPLAGSIACCATADALMAGDWDGRIGSGPPRPLRLAVLQTLVMEGLDAQVADDFARSLNNLKRAGVGVEDVQFDALLELPSLLKRGGLVGAEASFVHRELLDTRSADYDPRVSGRIALGASVSAADYLKIRQKRAEIMAAFASMARGFDAIVLPTVANIPPLLTDFLKDDDYLRLNGLALRNTYVANFINGCALTLPMNQVHSAPTGFMAMAPWGCDQALFSVANSIRSLT
jgi:aspartyl-tRNA(Asn)/glutamyl-tRNA(Gln) amidotransferase subunit A